MDGRTRSGERGFVLSTVSQPTGAEFPSAVQAGRNCVAQIDWQHDSADDEGLPQSLGRDPWRGDPGFGKSGDRDREEDSRENADLAST